MVRGLGAGGGERVRVRDRSSGWAVMLALLLQCAPAVGVAQPVANRTRAARGIAWGAGLGAALGGLGLGVLAGGLCDAADCSGSFGEGFLVGFLAGGAAGGITGLVVGSAFPAAGRSLGGRSWTVRGGGRQAVGADDIKGGGPTFGLRTLRATTERTWFGVSGEYLGPASHRETFQIRNRDGILENATTLRKWQISGLRLVAARAMGETAESGAYLMAGVGVYPTWETSTFTRFIDGGAPEQNIDRSFVAAPGVGVGGGYGLAAAATWSVVFDVRADMVGGISGDALASIVQVAVGLRHGSGRPSG